MWTLRSPDSGRMLLLQDSASRLAQHARLTLVNIQRMSNAICDCILNPNRTAGCGTSFCVKRATCCRCDTSPWQVCVELLSLRCDSCLFGLGWFEAERAGRSQHADVLLVCRMLALAVHMQATGCNAVNSAMLRRGTCIPVLLCSSIVSMSILKVSYETLSSAAAVISSAETSAQLQRMHSDIAPLHLPGPQRGP